MQTLSLVIPAYNETQRLPALLDVLRGSAREAVAGAGLELVESLIVDDGSTDGSRALLEAAATPDGTIRPILDLKENRGKGAAFRAGVMHARGDYVLMADVDLSTPLEELPKLTKALAEEGAEIAIGSRGVEGAVVERGPAHRKLLGKSFNATVRLLTGLSVHDTQCGFKLIPTAAAKTLLADQTCPGFAFDVELLMRADAAGIKVAEVPVFYLHDFRSSVQVLPASAKMLREVSKLAYRMRLRGARAPRRVSPPSVDLSADDSDGDAGRQADAGGDQSRLQSHRQS